MTDTGNLELSVKNFGPIAEAEIDLRPLTVFVGPSNTGKSYLAILIYALHGLFRGHQWTPSLGRGVIRRSLAPPPPGLGDRELSTGEADTLADWVEQLLLQRGANPLPDARAAIPEQSASVISALMADTGSLGEVFNYEVARCFGAEDTQRLVRHRSRGGARILVSRRTPESGKESEPVSYSLTLKNGEALLGAAIPENTPAQIEWSDDEGQFHWSEIRRISSYLAQTRNDEGFDRSRLARLLAEYVAEIARLHIVSPLSRAAHYLPADRTGVMHAHRVVVGSLIARAPRAGLGHVATEPVLSGVLADFLEELIGLGDSRSRRSKTGNLSKRIESGMLDGSIVGEDSDIGYPEFYYQPKGMGTRIPLMNSSSMVSELAPVVLYLRHVVQPGDVLIIEEPESHLHPEMQVEFTRQLAAAVNSGIRVMLTTHSEWVLEELANLIRLSDLSESHKKEFTAPDSALSAEDVGIWLFKPSKRPGGTIVKEIPLDLEIGNFQSGFDDVATGTYNRWARISNFIEENGPR